MDNAILLISCPDKRGITATVTAFIFQNNGNIEHADQHIDQQTNTFFMRIEWSLDKFHIPPEKIKEKFAPIAAKFKMNWSLYLTRNTPRVAIFVSKLTHVLYDLLLRFKEGQLPCKIAMIISNHSAAKKVAEDFGVKFYEFSKDHRNRATVEKAEIALLKKEKIELIVLARYMQIFSKKFIDEFENQIINIHHSFLPAFKGSDPYKQAYGRGVKIIGATSHYVTADLDSGPIIEQDTVRISHRDTIVDLKTKGKDLEKLVLSRAVRLYLERKILVYSNKTVIFD